MSPGKSDWSFTVPYFMTIYLVYYFTCEDGKPFHNLSYYSSNEILNIKRSTVTWLSYCPHILYVLIIYIKKIKTGDFSR